MAIEAAFQILLEKFGAAREAFDGLRLTAIEDRPLRDEVLLVDRLGNVVDDLRGWLEEAFAAANEAQRAIRHPLDGYRARRSLALANERFTRVEYKFFFDGVSYEEIDELSRFGRRRGREWLGWTGSVIQALDQCRAPLRDIDAALLACWQELAERLGTTANSVSVQTTTIGQQISGAMLAPGDVQRDSGDLPQNAMT